MPIPGGSNDLYFASGIDNSGLQRGATQAVGIIRGMASQISKQDVFAGLAIGATIAFSKASSELKDFSEQFEHSMKEVQTISQAVQDDFNGYSQAIVDMSTTVPQTANELAKAYYQIVSAGYDGAEGLDLLRTAAEGAVGGVSDVTTVADGVTTVLNAWKLSAAQSAEVSDVFFNTVERGKTNIGQLASNIAQVAPLAAAYGVSFRHIASATATLTKQGTTTSMAMTQLRQALIAVNEELGQGWSESMTLQDAFQEIANRAEESGKDVKDFTGRVEGAMAILGMTGENARGAAEDLESYAEAAGAAGSAFDVMMEDSINQSQTLKNNLMAALKPLGDFFAGKSTEFAKTINEAFASGDIEKFAKYLAIATTAMVAYNVSTKAATVSKMQFLRAVVRSKRAMQAFNIAAKANPIGLIVSGLAAATAAFIAFRQRTAEASKEYKQFMEDKGRAVSEMDALFGILEKVSKGSEAYSEALKAINEKYGDYLPNLLTEKSTLEDIKTAHEEAQRAMEERLTSAAKSTALSDATNEFINTRAGIKGKLLDDLSKSLGEEAAAIAVGSFDELTGKIHELYTIYDKLMKEGRTSDAGRIWKMMQTEVRSFVNTFTEGEDYNLVWNLAQRLHIEEGNLEQKQKEIEAIYSGFLKSVSESTVEGSESGSGTPGKTGFQILDLQSLEDQLQAAEQAFNELDKLRKAGLEGESGDQYKVFTQYGNNFDQYLAFMKDKYQDFGEQLKVINLAISEGILEGIALAEEGRIKLAEDTKEDWEQALKDMAKVIDATNREIDDAISIDLSKEKFEKVEKVFEFLGKIFTESELAELEYNINQFGRTVSNFGGVIGRFSDEAGEATRLFGQLITNAGAFVQFAASGGTDIFSLINGIIGMGDAIVGFVQVISGQARREAQEAAELERQAYQIAEAVKAINAGLEEQYYILERLSGAEWISGAKKTIKEINETIADFETQMRRINIEVEGPEVRHLHELDTEGWGAEDFEKALKDYGDVMPPETREQLEDFLNQIKDLKREAEDLQIEIKLETVGFDLETLLDDVMAVFQDMEDGAVDFGQTFEEVMMKAIMNTFKNTVVMRVMQEFYDRLFEAMDSEPTSREDRAGSLGNITQDEFAELEELWGERMDAIRNQWETLQMFFENVGVDTSSDAEDPNSLAGSIRRNLTEETGSLLAGRMNNMMLTMYEMAGFQAQMVDRLAGIEANTSYNRHLAQMQADLREIRTQLSA